MVESQHLQDMKYMWQQLSDAERLIVATNLHRSRFLEITIDRKRRAVTPWDIQDWLDTWARTPSRNAGEATSTPS